MSRTPTPAKRGHAIAQYRTKDVGAVFHTELIGDSEQQSSGGGDRLILSQVLDEPLRLSGAPIDEIWLKSLRWWITQARGR
jgi:hypothetical protein